MFSNFKDAFIKKPQFTVSPPQAVLDSLSTNLPDGFYYVHDHDGYCKIDCSKGLNINSGKVILAESDKDVFCGEYNLNNLMMYCYNSQTPLAIAPDENGFYTVNGVKIKASDFIRAPMKNVSLTTMRFYLYPPEFPAPFDVIIKGDEYELSISMRRTANHSIVTQRFESVSPSPIKLIYTIDTKSGKCNFTISISTNKISSVRQIVSANHIYNAFIHGNGYIFDTLIDGVPNVDSSAISQETVDFWDMVLSLESKLNVTFNASNGVTYNDGNKLLELKRSFLDRKPFKLKKTYNTVSGTGNSHKYVEISDMVGKELYFEFEETEIVEIMDTKLSYYGLVAIFGATVKSISMPENDMTGTFNVELITTSGKTMCSSTMYFMSEEELKQYRNNQNHIEEFEKADFLEYLI